MAIKITKNDIVWGYAGTILYNGINIIILPFILKYLPARELGLWFTLTAIAGLASLIDFGFTLTISRNISYAWSGATKICDSGIACNEARDEPNIALFAKVLTVCKFIYLGAATILLLLLSTVGTHYIMAITENNIEQSDYCSTWILFVFAIVLNVYYAYWTPVLTGIGAIKQNYQALVIAKLLQLVLSTIGLLLGYKLLAVAIGYVAGTVGQRILCRYFFFHHTEVKILQNAIHVRTSVNDKISTFHAMWPSAYKQGVLTISKFLADKFSTLLCSAFLGLEMAAAYGLSMQMFQVIGTASSVLYNTMLPFFNHLRVKGDKQNAYKYFTLAVGVQSAVNLIGGFFIAFFSNQLLRLIGSQSSALPLFPSIVLYIFFLFHYNQNIFVSYIITSNEMPMYKPYLTSSILIISVQYLSIKFLENAGIWSLILPLLLIELSYNAWKWPVYVTKSFDVSVANFYIDSIANITNKIIGKRNNNI